MTPEAVWLTGEEPTLRSAPDGRRGHSRQCERTPNHLRPTRNVTSSSPASHQTSRPYERSTTTWVTVPVATSRRRSRQRGHPESTEERSESLVVPPTLVDEPVPERTVESGTENVAAFGC